MRIFNYVNFLIQQDKDILQAYQKRNCAHNLHVREGKETIKLNARAPV